MSADKSVIRSHTASSSKNLGNCSWALPLVESLFFMTSFQNRVKFHQVAPMRKW
ncbi:hypothetical protein D3C73_1561940 [compost metagenome]